ncbi:response regulator [Paenibacillus nanensis]|uniref:Response regulator n=1 Tax=Paenibacillus nanensis TaxID=393251 RepID=A0A3A1UV36_9BACL|nr:response regulator [Paenibacillus nanensis]RIX52408.1 response regulator [Paenibacillus nanensis]
MFKVIIVDDELIVRHAVKTLIQWENSRFEYGGSAPNGVGALELVERTNPDIVITDIKMPEMDGLSFIRQLMKARFQGEVLVLSNYNDFELVREALKMGAHDYLLKLTMNTESFMQVLEEMAAKLDERRVSETVLPISATPELDGFQVRVGRLLEMADQGIDTDDGLINEQLEDSLTKQGIWFYSFIIRALAEQTSSDRRPGLPDMLERLADSIWPDSRVRVAVQRGPERALLVIGCQAGQAVAPPEEMARRLNSLAGMYYNVPLFIVYAQAAIGMAELAGEIKASRDTEARLIGAPERTRAACMPNRDKAEKAGPPNAVYREEVQKALAYLEEHYTERISIADIAAKVGLSEPYLCQIFKAETNVSIMTRLNEIRMDKAYELLATGQYLVKQAALEVGISDPFYFNRLFKKRFGISPKNVIKS